MIITNNKDKYIDFKYDEAKFTNTILKRTVFSSNEDKEAYLENGDKINTNSFHLTIITKPGLIEQIDKFDSKEGLTFIIEDFRFEEYTSYLIVKGQICSREIKVIDGEPLLEIVVNGISYIQNNKCCFYRYFSNNNWSKWNKKVPDIQSEEKRFSINLFEDLEI